MLCRQPGKSLRARRYGFEVFPAGELDHRFQDNPLQSRDPDETRRDHVRLVRRRKLLERVNDIRLGVKIPVVANGEIWTVDDARRCRQASGCDSLMLGRGMVTDPGLALAIRGDVGGGLDGYAAPLVPWAEILLLMGGFWQLVVARLERRQQAGRLKQWLNFMRHRYPEAQEAYDALRTLHDPELVTQWLRLHGALDAQVLQK